METRDLKINLSLHSDVTWSSYAQSPKLGCTRKMTGPSMRNINF